MENKQELEWAEAQKIEVSMDLVAAAKQQLQFLAAVDKHGQLYKGSVLHRAIQRYKYCWLPLLAKYAEFTISEGPLVVPLDCEWIWHCHRLNPVQYKADCEQLYGRILDNWNVKSSIQGSSSKQTEKIWDRLYPDEPHHLNLSNPSKDVSFSNANTTNSITYDLLSAVQRQSSFFYQVSRPFMANDIFLQESLARYKGFLHLIRKNRERNIKSFCVPTYDIDLIWHSHQLHPNLYCKDMEAIYGDILEHDDTDSDRTKGKKLVIGFAETTKQWEDVYASRYWKAGVMYKSNARPLKTIVPPLDAASKKTTPKNEYQNAFQLPKRLLIEVLLEVVEVKNLPPGHVDSNFFIFFGKNQLDLGVNSRRLSITSRTGEKQAAAFQCEPTGKLVLELVSSLSSKIIGTTHICLEDLLNPLRELSLQRWFEMVPPHGAGTAGAMPVLLYIALSFSPPVITECEVNGILSKDVTSCTEEVNASNKMATAWTAEVKNELLLEMESAACGFGCSGGGGGGGCGGGRCGGPCSSGRCSAGSCGDK
ncbi:hypothetical protein Ancab_028984 [Ancistrocladus abbreviatus]